MAVEPVIDPGFHVYVDPPLPVRVALFPAQIAEALLTAFIVGVGLTIKLTVLVVVQLLVDPVTV